MTANRYRSKPESDRRAAASGAKFLDAFTSEDQNSTVTNTNDSFNRFDTTTKTTENAGNTSLTIGASGAGENVTLLIVAGAVLGGLALILTR
jgi:hypothetical protein